MTVLYLFYNSAVDCVQVA